MSPGLRYGAVQVNLKDTEPGVLAESRRCCRSWVWQRWIGYHTTGNRGLTNALD